MYLLINPKFNSKSGDQNQATDVPSHVRYLNCIGEDAANKYSFHLTSFIECAELKLIQNNGKQFTQRILFDLDLSEDVMTDAKVLQKLLNRAR